MSEDVNDQIDRAIALAQDKKAKTILTKEEKKAASDQKKLDRQTAKEDRKNERLSRQANKKREREENGQVHMKKVQKAAQKLGTLSETAQNIFNDATTNLTAGEITNLAGHLGHFNRARATELSLKHSFQPGMRVNIARGEGRYVGKSGVITKAQRIRAYVQVDGVEKPIYTFCADLETTVATNQQEAATGT